MALYEALYRRKCHSPIGWFEPGKARLLGTYLVPDAMEKVFGGVSPKKSVMRFWKNGKLSPRYIGPFEVLESCWMRIWLTKEELVAILDRQVLKLRSKVSASVKVQCRG
ncbi:uncharacterized protein [Nicotiana tomentosiformis]|uniref:uncharacterized protein n=1 Tax=Nicotiana tomentosiformis TaxID=4098 RepID=UPI00388CB772